jgi:capsular exopolysaccharide synthesis family protein
VKLIWRGRWTVLAFLLAAVTLSVVLTLLKTPVYKATATVEIQPVARRLMRGEDMSGLGAQGYGWSAEERYFNTQLEIVSSRAVARQVVDRLHLDQDPRFAGGDDPVAALASRVQVRPRKNTGIIEVSLNGTDPEAITDWVNTLAHVYVERNVAEATKEVERVIGQIREQMEVLRDDVEAKREESLAAAEEEGIFVPEGQQNLLEAELRQLIEEHNKARLEVSNLESIKSTLDGLLEGRGDPMLIEEVARDATVQNLMRTKAELENNLATLRLTRKPGHPEYREAESQLESAREQLAGHYSTILERVRSRYQTAVAQERYLARELGQKRKDAADLGRRAGSYEVARGETEARQRIYDLAVQRLEEIDLSANVLSNNLRVVDEAIVPASPISPRKTLNLAAGIILGLFLGLGAVFLLDYLDNTVKSAEDIEHDLDLNLLAVVPRRRSRDGRAVKEALQTLRTSVLFSSKGRTQRVLLTTSAGPREGKSSTIADLAMTLAATGESVVLIDCDLRRPTIHTHFDLVRDHGLSNYLVAREGTDWREFVNETATPGLSVMTCGPIPPNPADLFNSKRFRDLLAALKESYDWVLVDSPPVLSLADTVILASLVDMVALVVKHNENDKEMIRRCLKQIRDVNPNVIGAVLNSVDLQKDGSGYYYAGYYYEQKDGKRVRRGRRSRGRGETEGGGESPGGPRAGEAG